MTGEPSQEGRAPPRQEETRRSNDRIARAAVEHHFGPDVGVPFMCECRDPLCVEFVTLTLRQFGRGRREGSVTAPGHEA